MTRDPVRALSDEEKTEVLPDTEAKDEDPFISAVVLTLLGLRWTGMVPEETMMKRETTFLNIEDLAQKET